MVTVTATDPSQASATIDVTINVTDVNEAPVIAQDDDLVKEFRENSASTIQTFRATDPERRPVYWSLKDDATTITKIEGDSPSAAPGPSASRLPPDYENPSDGDTDNTYKVIVVASDDAPGAGTMKSANCLEEGHRHRHQRGERGSDHRKPALSPGGVAVTATLTDGDGLTTSEAIRHQLAMVQRKHWKNELARGLIRQLIHPAS